MSDKVNDKNTKKERRLTKNGTIDRRGGGRKGAGRRKSADPRMGFYVYALKSQVLNHETGEFPVGSKESLKEAVRVIQEKTQKFVQDNF